MSHGQQWIAHRMTDKRNKAEKPVLDEVWPVHSAGG